MIRIILSFVCIVFNISVFGQLRLDTLGWRSPVDIPLYLSGNFAELRSTHFHAGIDIKTQGKEGFKVYAVYDGYISRIKIAPGGYGKSVYINHPDGYTSVYAHLRELNIQLEKYTRTRQYKNENYEIDIFPEKDELPVKMGDIIGLSGNTGSSGGPHLHFEVRDTKTSKPLNGLFLGYDIKDNIPPRMDYLYVYPQNNYSAVNGKNTNHFYSLKNLGDRYALRQGDTITMSGSVGLGLKVNDYLNGSSNQCGVFELKVTLDDSIIFHNKFDDLSFDEVRYINCYMDYKENIDKKRKLHKLFIDPNNRLSVYIDTINRGIIDIASDVKVKKVTIEAFDAYKNSSRLVFYVKPKTQSKPFFTQTKNTITIPWQNEFRLDTLGLTMRMNKETLYDTLFMDFSIDTMPSNEVYSALYNIHNSYTPVHKNFEVAIIPNAVADSLKQKLLLGIWKNNKYESAGGTFANGKVTGLVRELGSYAVLLDTVKPQIRPMGSIATGNDLSNTTKLQFTITDQLSGIESYRGTINDNWVLFEYDAKNDLITYEFDEYMPSEGLVSVKVEVLDKKGNTAIFQKQCEVYPEKANDIGQ